MQRIFLMGLEGSGKSTVGRRLAALLNWDFIDTSELLAEKPGLSIDQTSIDYDEERLREVESEILRSVVSREHLIIAISGGMAIEETNRALMQEQGLTVYLQTTVETAWQRLQAQRRVDGQSVIPAWIAEADGQQRLRDLLVTRQPGYEEASLSLKTDEHTPETLALRIIVNALACGYLLAPDSARVSCNLRLTSALSQAVIEWGGLSQLPEALRALGKQERVFLVTDSSVGALYAGAVCALLEAANFRPLLFTIPAGEASKSADCFEQIIDWLVEQRAERSEPLIAFGGGVVGDLVGFVASAYQRGVPLIQLPTTLLAQVDSAVGGKTGINHPLGKNLIGAFYQPGLIFVDPALLLTLPERVYCEGWAEIIKYGVIMDEELFVLLEGRLPDLKRRAADLLTQVVARCIRLKMDVVQGDERDGGLRNILNYGHTFGHALEATTHYGVWLHGEAVSVGMEVAGRIAVARGLISQNDLERQRKLLQAIGLPIECPGVDGEIILAAMQHDKKVQAGRTRWILPTRIGNAQIYSDIPVEDVREAIASVCQPRR